MPSIFGAGKTSLRLPSMTLISDPSDPSSFDTIETWAIEAILARASPLKPNVSMANKSFRLDNLLVWKRFRALGNWSFLIPTPLSRTWISWLPPCSMTISICFALASKLFSSSSLTTDEGLSTLLQLKFYFADPPINVKYPL